MLWRKTLMTTYQPDPEFIQGIGHGRTLTLANAALPVEEGDLLVTGYVGSVISGTPVALTANSGQGLLSDYIYGARYLAVYYYVVQSGDTTISWNEPHVSDDWRTHHYRGNFSNIAVDFAKDFYGDGKGITEDASSGPCLKLFTSGNDGSSGLSTSGMDTSYRSEAGGLHFSSGLDFDGIGSITLNQSGAYPSTGGILTF